MPVEALSGFNWVDVLLAAICIRTVYVGVKNGFVVEMFKTLGVLFAVFVTLHYYGGMSKFIQEKTHLPQGITDAVIFGILWALVVVIFKFVRDGFTVLFRVEAHSLLDRWGGLAVCVFRAALLCSMAVLLLRALSSDYLTKNLQKSLTAPKLVWLSPRVYEACYDNFVSKFFPNETLNKSVFTLTDLNVEEKNEKKKK